MRKVSHFPQLRWQQGCSRWRRWAKLEWQQRSYQVWLLLVVIIYGYAEIIWCLTKGNFHFLCRLYVQLHTGFVLGLFFRSWVHKIWLQRYVSTLSKWSRHVPPPQENRWRFSLRIGFTQLFLYSLIVINFTVNWIHAIKNMLVSNLPLVFAYLGHYNFTCFRYAITYPLDSFMKKN